MRIRRPQRGDFAALAVSVLVGAAASSAVLAQTVPAQPTATPSTILGKKLPVGCKGDVCRLFSIEDKGLDKQTDEGELYRIRTKDWTRAKLAGKSRDGEPREGPLLGGQSQTAYVFCSKTHPAFIYRGGIESRTWVVYWLAPGSEAGILGYNKGSYPAYFAVCHDFEVQYDDNAIVSAGKELGYAVDASSVGVSNMDDPEDVLKP